MNKPYAVDPIASDVLFTGGAMTGDPTKLAPSAGVASQGHVPYAGWGARWQNHHEYARDALGAWLGFRPLIDFRPFVQWTANYGTIMSIVDGLDGSTRISTTSKDIIIVRDRPDYETVRTTDGNWSTAAPIAECTSVPGGKIGQLSSSGGILYRAHVNSVESASAPTPTSIGASSSYLDLALSSYFKGTTDYGWVWRAGPLFGWFTSAGESGTFTAPSGFADGVLARMAGYSSTLVLCGGDAGDTTLQCWSKVAGASWVAMADVTDPIRKPIDLVWDPVLFQWVLLTDDGQIFTNPSLDCTEAWVQRCEPRWTGATWTGTYGKIIGSSTAIVSPHMGANPGEIHITEDFGQNWQRFTSDATTLGVKYFGNRYLYTWYANGTGWRVYRAGPIDRQFQ
jgi:hypothetical protein